MQKLKIALFAFLMVLGTASAASAHNPNYTKARSYDDLLDQAAEMGYTVWTVHVPPTSSGVIHCGITRTAERTITLNTHSHCAPNISAHLAHELGHVVMTEPSWNTVDSVKFQGLRPLGGALFSSWCADAEVVSFADYENSVCEVYAGAAAVANGQPHRRSATPRIAITSEMVRSARTDLMVQLDPVYACQVALSYRAWLGRQADTSGYEYWMDKGWSLNWQVRWIVGQGIWPSAEYQNGNIASYNNWQFSWLMISNAFGRPPVSWNEQDQWRDYINTHGRVAAWEHILNRSDDRNLGPCGTFASARTYLNSQQI